MGYVQCSSRPWNLCTRRWQQGGSLIVWLQFGWRADKSRSLKSCCMSWDFRCDFECLSKCTLWKASTNSTAFLHLPPSETQLLFNCFGEFGFWQDRIKPMANYIKGRLKERHAPSDGTCNCTGSHAMQAVYCLERQKHGEMERDGERWRKGCRSRSHRTLPKIVKLLSANQLLGQFLISSSNPSRICTRSIQTFLKCRPQTWISSCLLHLYPSDQPFDETMCVSHDKSIKKLSTVSYWPRKHVWRVYQSVSKMYHI